MKYADSTIGSVSDLVAALAAFYKPGETVWFRGQENQAWDLRPSIARHAKGIDAEIMLMKRFTQNAIPHLASRPSGEWEWLFVMQHYGVPTRLLDWSESPLVGLFFAVWDNPRENGNDAALWCLSPIDLNKGSRLSFKFPSELPTFDQDSDVLGAYLPTSVAIDRKSDLGPVAVIALRDSARIYAQLGAFTITHREQTPIDSIAPLDHIWRLLIPASAKDRIRQELASLSFNKLTLFPELPNVALTAKELLA